MPKLVRCTLEIATYVNKDIRVNYKLKETFNPGGLTVGFLSGCAFLQKLLETPRCGRSSPMSETMAPLTTIQTLLFFHGLRYLAIPISTNLAWMHNCPMFRLYTGVLPGI